MAGICMYMREGSDVTAKSKCGTRRWKDVFFSFFFFLSGENRDVR